MKRSLQVMVAALIALAVAGAACQPRSGMDPTATPPEGPAGAADREQDWAAIQRLEAEAKAIARTTGCTSAAGCETAPVGNRACGGPRYYLVFCAATTDQQALSAKLNQIVQAENEYNRKYGIISTCEFRMPPEIAFTGGECRAATEQRTTP